MTDAPVRLDDLIAQVAGQKAAGEPLAQLAAAVELAAHLCEVSDHLVGHFVDQARRSGASWTEIGQHMGVSKQAVQKRFVPKPSEDPDFPVGGRLSRFTPRAHNVVAQAKAEARGHKQDEVTNEHLVLGLLSEPDGLAARAIVELGVPRERARAVFEAVLPSGRRTPVRVRFGRGTKKTLELALREALRLGHNYIGTEHLLLGLLRNEKEGAAGLLVDLGVTRGRAEEWLRAEFARIQQERGQVCG